jgi:hypothetical protein
MTGKPIKASGYTPEHLAKARSLCLYVATKLGDLMDDVVVVGGLVPSLLINPEDLPAGEAAHVGTMDLDVGFALRLLESGMYHTVSERLRTAGFIQDKNAEGRPTTHRWRLREGASATVDFLIPPTRKTDRGGRLKNLEKDFAAVFAPGLHLAFRDRSRVSLSGTTPAGEKAEREIWVCGPGAFVVLKALAFHDRGENKDAYDLYYVLRCFGGGPSDVARCFRPLIDDPDTIRAMHILEQDFKANDCLGPMRVAHFVHGGPDEATQADVVGFVLKFLSMCTPEDRRGRPSPGSM